MKGRTRRNEFSRSRRELSKGWVYTTPGQWPLSRNSRYSRDWTSPSSPTDLSSLPFRWCSYSRVRLPPNLPVSFKLNETLAGRWRKDMCLIYARVKRNCSGGWNRSTQFRGPVAIVDVIKSRINCFDDTQRPWKGRVLLFSFSFFFNLWRNMSKLWTFVKSCIFNH